MKKGKSTKECERRSTLLLMSFIKKENKKKEKPTKECKCRSKSSPAEDRKAKEADIRRKVNKRWQKVEATDKYRKAASQSVWRNTTDKIEDELLDGILISLNARNGVKSASEQKRLLRRIVEKQQSQAIHTKTRKSRDRKAAVAAINNSSRCLKRLQHLQFAY